MCIFVLLQCLLLALYLMVLSVLNLIHWGKGLFCFWALAIFCLVLKDFWDYKVSISSFVIPCILWSLYIPASLKYRDQSGFCRLLEKSFDHRDSRFIVGSHDKVRILVLTRPRVTAFPPF